MADERDLEPMEPIASVGEFTRRRLEALGARLTERNQEPTYRCHVCRDTGYSSRRKPDRFTDLCWLAAPCEGADRAPCPFGIPVEAGLWARAMKPRRGEAAAPGDIVAKYRNRLHEHANGVELRTAVDRALAREEEAR